MPAKTLNAVPKARRQQVIRLKRVAVERPARRDTAKHPPIDRRLLRLPSREDRNELIRQWENGFAALGLGLANELAYEAALNAHRASGKIDVFPTQAEYFANTHSSEDGDGNHNSHMMRNFLVPQIRT